MIGKYRSNAETKFWREALHHENQAKRQFQHMFSDYTDAKYFQGQHIDMHQQAVDKLKTPKKQYINRWEDL